MRAETRDGGVARPGRAAKILGALLFGATAGAAAALSLGEDRLLDMRALRETLPLAVVLGGFLGYAATPRWPATLTEAVVLGVLAAGIGFVFFSALYLFAEAVITATQGGSAGAAVTGATERLMASAPVALGVLAAGFTASGLLMWIIGALVRWRRKHAES